MFKIGLPNRTAACQALIDAFSTMEMRIYDDSGVVPTNPGDAIGSAVLLAVITVDDDDTPVTFEAAASGLIQKATDEEWIGTFVASGTKSFYRIVEQDDADDADTTKPRIQGEIGLLGADLNVSSLSAVIGEEQRIDSFIVGQPAYGS